MDYEIHPAIARHLAQRGLTETAEIHDFLFPELSELPPPALFKSMDTAVALVIEGLEDNADILIWGDYDVDGITGTALLVMFFRAIGVDVKHHIPDRLTEGYGLNSERISEFAATMGKKKLLITVDCGISNSTEITVAQELGFRVIVTDHHQVPDGELCAEATINPRQHDCSFPFKELAGVGVSFYLAAGIRAELRNRNDLFSISCDLNLKSFLDLVSIGTLADMMPLAGVNRILAKAGFESIGANTSSLVAVLLKGLNIDPRHLAGENVAFQVAPVINAAGRMGEPDVPFTMLTSRSAEEAEPLVRKMVQLNERRKQISRQDFERAERMISRLEVEQDKCIVVCSDFHEGILGITASRLMERYRVPALVCCRHPNDGMLIKGSGRAPAHTNLYESLAQCRNWLISFGGHEAAAGFSLSTDNFPILQREFKLSISAYYENSDSELSNLQTKFIDLSLSDALDRVLINNLYQLEPFGEGNPKPIFCDTSVQLVSIVFFGSRNEHVRGTARGRYQNIPFIGFNKGDKFASIDSRMPVALSYTHLLDIYNGRLSWKIRIDNAWQSGQTLP